MHPLFVHKKKRGRMKAIRGKNGRQDRRMDGSSIEKRDESDMAGKLNGWIDGWSTSGSHTWVNAGFNGI